MNLQLYSLQLPKSAEWPKWKHQFEQYRQASRLVEKDEQRQISTLLYYLGEEAEEILATNHISDKNKKKYQSYWRIWQVFHSEEEHDLWMLAL